MDGQGNAIVAWNVASGATHSVQAAVRPKGGPWGAAEYISDEGAAPFFLSPPSVAVNAGGSAVVFFVHKETGEAARVQAARRPAGGPWVPAEYVSPAGADATFQDGGIDAAGNAIAVWTRVTGSVLVQAAVRPADGTWGAPDDLSAATTTGIPDSRVAVTPSGAATAIWRRHDGSTYLVEAASRPAGGAWGAAETLSIPTGNGNEPDVAVHPSGKTIAIWSASDGTNTRIQASVRQAGQTSWSQLRNISAAGQHSGLAHARFDAAGNAGAVWVRSDGTHFRVQGAGYDAAPPVVKRVQVPTAGRVGRTVTMSRVALDVWSALKPAVWQFGDGSTAKGAKVTHVYRRAGRFTVRLTQKDGLGNATTITRVIRIRR